MRIVLFDATTGKTYTFTQSVVVLGRLPNCDLRFDLPPVSRRHAELRLRGEEAFLIDLASTNGVTVNNQAIAPMHEVKLRAGDEIHLGGASGPTLVVREIGPPLADTLPSEEDEAAAVREDYPSIEDNLPNVVAEQEVVDEAAAEARREAEWQRLNAEALQRQEEVRRRTEEAVLRLRAEAEARRRAEEAEQVRAEVETLRRAQEEARQSVAAAAPPGTRPCPNCGHPSPAAKAFCPECGDPMESEERPRELRGIERMDATNFGAWAEKYARPTPAQPPVAAPPAQSSPPPAQSALPAAPPPEEFAAPTVPLPKSVPQQVSYSLPSAPPPELPASARSAGGLPGLLLAPFTLASRAWQAFNKNRRGTGDLSPAPAPAPVSAEPTARLQADDPGDVVDCTVYAPPQVSRGAAFLVQTFVHLPEMEEMVRAMAREFDRAATRRGCRSLAVAVEQGARLDFHLAMPGLEVEHPGYSLVWRRRPDAVQFAVRVPRDHAGGDALGKVTISLAGLPVGHINFKVTVTAQTVAHDPQPTGESRAYRRAFLSFAPEDRAEVGKRAQMLAPLKIAVDADTLTAARPVTADFARIDESDLFLLFWSHAARRSPLVLSEIEYALYRKRGDAAAPPEIMPVVLEGPPAPPAPESLSDVSFDDYLPYFDSSTAPTVIDERESWSDPLGHLLNNRYFVEERIGAGGFGEVYRARDEQLAARPVVVKTLRADGLNNPWALHKFRHEIEALARLDHPAVVGIFDAGQLPGGAPFLVMQFVNGQSLRVGLSAGGMNLAQAAQIVQQVASALTEAHAQGILHRDLKPENIMLRRLNAGETQAVVIDFGVAKVRNSALAPGTDDGRIAGTYLYMSPEQVMGGRLDATSDVYSLGVVAYEMLTGRRPFAPQSLAQLPEMQRRRMFDAPCDLRPDLPPAAQASLLQALAHNPAHRYQSAQQFGDALARALQQ